MRLYEIINEDATAGGTAAGSVATVAMPLQTTAKGDSFFGATPDMYPKGSKPAVIRREIPSNKKKKKAKK